MSLFLHPQFTRRKPQLAATSKVVVERRFIFLGHEEAIERSKRLITILVSGATALTVKSMMSNSNDTKKGTHEN